MFKPTWTKRTPRDPGLYWYRLDGSTALRYCRVVRIDGILVTNNGEGMIPVSRMARAWAGPLHEPQEERS